MQLDSSISLSHSQTRLENYVEKTVQSSTHTVVVGWPATISSFVNFRRSNKDKDSRSTCCCFSESKKLSLITGASTLRGAPEAKGKQIMNGNVRDNRGRKVKLNESFYRTDVLRS